MPTIDDVAAVLERLAPPRLAEDWDNVGLLVGDRDAEARRVMTCLTLTPHSVAEAVRREADLVVAHHPLPFRPIRRLTTDSVEGRLLWDLMGAGVAVYSPHTAFDSAAGGINQRLAAGFGLTGAEPLLPADNDPAIGAGRVASPPAAADVAGLLAEIKAFLGLPAVRFVGDLTNRVGRVAIACGSGGSLLDAAIEAGCDAFITGEAGFHDCLKAEARGVTLVLLGHYASERFAVEALAGALADEIPGAEVWPSADEHDPIQEG